MKKGESVGLIAGTLTTIAFVPQVYGVWSRRPHPAQGVSLGMFVIFSAGVFLWTVYGFKIKSPSVIVFNIITFFLAGSILAYKLIYG